MTNAEAALQQVRNEVSLLLEQATDQLDAQSLYTLVHQKIAELRAARDQAHGGGGTFTLNGLLAAEMRLRTRVFGVPPPTIKPDF